MKAPLASHRHELSDDDLTRIDGQRDRLARALHERLGLDATAAEAVICASEKDVCRPGTVK